MEAKHLVNAREMVLRACGDVSRRVHAHGFVSGKPSGAIRLMAGKLATHGTYPYRNHVGHRLEADMSDYMERIGFFGAHSARLIRYVASCLRPGDWAIDAGANVGLVSSPMSAAVGLSGHVWAIEPLPSNVERLRALKSANNLAQLEIFPLALSASPAIARLRLSSLPGGSGSGSFVAPWARDDFIEVPTVPLDQLIRDQGSTGDLRLLKVDVEGFEAELLEGARRTLTTMSPIVVCEFHDALLRAAGSSSGKLLAQFADYGYVPAEPFGLPSRPLEGAVVDMLLRKL